MDETLKILVIDDNPHLILLIRNLLSDENCLIFEAGNGETGLEMVNKHKPDLVLLDVMMPGMDGFEVCRKIKFDPATREVVVVMVSALATGSDDQSGILENCADGYIVLPITNREFIARIRAFMRIIKTEKKLRYNREIFEDIFETVHDGILYLAFTGEILTINTSLEKNLDLTRGEVVGGNILSLLRQLLNKKNLKVVIQVFRTFLQGGDLNPFQLVYRDKVLSIKPVYNQRSHRFTVVVQDITVLMAAQKSLEEMNITLEKRVIDRTFELQSINRELEAFSYSVSHDLRAPLRAIDGFTRIFQETHTASIDQEGLNLLDLIHRNTISMGQLIDDLLAFSRLTKRDFNYMKINMAELAHEVFEELTSPEIRKIIRFTVKEIPSVVGDPPMVRQLWRNLIGNAIKFSAPRTQPEIEISSFPDDSKTVYSIRDNGVGFNMQYAHKLFDIFQRLHPTSEFEGTGVGLAIVQRIVLRHHGYIRAEGKEGEGAVFYFTLAADNQISVNL